MPSKTPDRGDQYATVYMPDGSDLLTRFDRFYRVGRDAKPGRAPKIREAMEMQLMIDRLLAEHDYAQFFDRPGDLRRWVKQAILDQIREEIEELGEPEPPSDDT